MLPYICKEENPNQIKQSFKYTAHPLLPKRMDFVVASLTPLVFPAWGSQAGLPAPWHQCSQSPPAVTSVPANSAQGEPHLPKASFSQHHQEVEIRELHPVPAAVVVQFGNGISCLLIRGLGAGSNLGSLQRWGWGREEENTWLMGQGEWALQTQWVFPKSHLSSSFPSQNPP